jgi:DNA-binding transcriptional ArsR family regulator
MPLITPVQARPKVEFAVSESLDLLNAMYFTFLVEEYEGIDGWPEATRRAMRSDLLDELKLLHTFPRGEPGIIGALQEAAFLHRETWDSVDALVKFVRNLEPVGKSMAERPGIQILAHYAMRFPCDWVGTRHEVTHSREELARELLEAPPRESSAEIMSELDPATTLALFDDPEQLRERTARLIEDFDREHYRPDATRRMAILRKDVEARRALGDDPITVARAVMGRDRVGLEDMVDRYSRFVFVPSIDVGVYHNSTTDIDTFGLFYAASPEAAGNGAGDQTEQLARLYKALADPQRLKILSLLSDGELYAQEIVERTGLHQSVVSRHLSFLKGVGLLNVRKQNNMKFFSLNQEKRSELLRSVERVMPFTSTVEEPS